MEELMNRIGEVYEPFKVHFLHKPSCATSRLCSVCSRW